MLPMVMQEIKTAAMGPQKKKKRKSLTPLISR